MPNINLRDAHNRDALVRAQSVRQTAIVRYVGRDGGPARLRKVLKGTLENGYEALLAVHGGDADKLGAALVAGDPEADIERAGMFLTQTSRVWVNDQSRIVYRILQTEVVRGPDGAERERRPRRRASTNVDAEIPLTWTGRKVKRAEALIRFVFFRKLQIVHVNGLTYDFLYGIAKELAEADSLMLLGAGKSGKEPLIFSHGATPCRGFLEGRVDGDRYVLLLHLSKMELKRPAPVVPAEVAAAATATAPPPQPPVGATVTVPAGTPAPLAASAHAPPKPTVQEVLAATSQPAQTEPSAPAVTASAKEALRETVGAAKATKQRAKSSKVAAAAPAASPPAAQGAPAEAAPAAKPARKRASRAKPAGSTPAT